MPKQLKVVVFDLDGTLADTANIELLFSNNRSSFDVLSLTPPMDSQKRLLFDNSMIFKISYLIQCGIHVYLITRAPKPYASTLTYLLGIDFCGLIPSNPTFPSVSSKLAHISEITGADKSEMLYVGDLEEDELEARKFGCFFQYPTWANAHIGKNDHLSIWFELCYQRTVKDGHATGVSKILESKYEERIKRHALVSQIIQEDIIFSESFSICDSKGSILLNDVFRIPTASDIVLKPFINPHILTRFEYESNDDLKFNLFELIKLANLSSIPILPPNPETSIALSEVDLYAAVDYWKQPSLGSNLWTLIKNWNQSKGSGPKIHLHYLEIVALGISSGIYMRRQDIETESAFIVPVPSTRISSDHPGQISFRLAHRISQLTEIPLLSLITKEENGEFVSTMQRYPFSKSIYLIDDQITSGKNVIKSVETLRKLGVENLSVFVWSASKFEKLSLS
jgi:hypothetical protein